MNKAEQSSTSTEVPKTKSALLDKYKEEPVKEVTAESTKLPMPTGWSMLMLPFSMKSQPDGGLILGTETLDIPQFT